MSKFVDVGLDWLDLDDEEVEKYSEDQPRDDRGRWTGGGNWTKGGDSLPRASEPPLVRVVGVDFRPEFLHGTASRNIANLAAERTGEFSRKPSVPGIPSEMNEFGAALLLSEPRQAQQAFMFAQGKGNSLAIVTLRPGTKILDLSDEVTRSPTWTLGTEPPVLRFFERPAITDDMTEWKAGAITAGYKERNPEWAQNMRMDPSVVDFDVHSWRESLVPYARARGYGAVRFADETLLVDRGVIESARRATKAETAAAATARAFPWGKASLFTDKPAGARAEAARGGIAKYNPDQPRDDRGRWADADVFSAGRLQWVAGESGEVTVTPSHKEQYRMDVDAAYRGLAAGGQAELREPGQVQDLLDRVVAADRSARAVGGKAPVVNLSDLRVAGRTVFSAGPGAPARADMPQLRGEPKIGSRAEALPRVNGKVDVTEQFINDVRASGVGVARETVGAGYLVPTQGELNSLDVAQIVDRVRGGGPAQGKDIVVSRDSHIVDGHHTWAAAPVLTLVEGTPRTLAIERVDLPISDLLERAQAHAREWGIKQRRIGKVAKYSEDQPRDEWGRWTGGGIAFHGTRYENARAILSEGLLASKSGSTWRISKPGHVYVTSGMQNAAEWAKAAEGPKKGQAVILEVHIPKEKEVFLSIDENFRDFEPSTRTGVQLQFSEDIRPEWIARAWMSIPEGLQTGGPHNDILTPDKHPEKWIVLKTVETAGRTVYVVVMLPPEIAKYSEDQPRDEQGRWSGGGGAGVDEGVQAPDVDERGIAPRTREVSAETRAWLSRVEASPEVRAVEARIADATAAGQATDALYRNPDGTWRAERARTHEDIVHGILNPHAVVPAGERPSVIMMMGPGGAGKGTVLQREVDTSRYTVINADDAKQALPEYRGWNAALLHEESSHVTDRLALGRAVEARHNIVIDATGKTAAKYVGFAESFRGLGYDVTAIHVDLPPEVAAQRAYDRFVRGGPNGRYVPLRRIVEDMDDKPVDTYNALKECGLVDRAVEYDNNVRRGEPSRKVEDRTYRRARKRAEGPGGGPRGEHRADAGRGLSRVEVVAAIDEFLERVTKYSEDQPRDERGMWTRAGSPSRGGSFLHGTSRVLLSEDEAANQSHDVEKALFVESGAAPDEPEWRALHRAADRATPRARNAFLRAVAATRDDVDLDVLEAAIAARDYEAAFAAVPWEDVAERTIASSMPKVLIEIIEDSGYATAVTLRRAGVAMRFDATNPRAVVAARTQTADLVTAVSASTKDSIRSVMARSFREGIPPRDAAKLIKPLVGLRERQAVAVTNLWAKLTDDGEANVDEKVERYADRLLGQRALDIARTETIRASSIGQKETWNQAKDLGLLRGDEKRRWSAADSPRTCLICEYLDGKVVGFDESFVGEDGEEYDLPPDPHPDCRCSIVLEVDSIDPSDEDAEKRWVAKYSEDQERDESEVEVDDLAAAVVRVIDALVEKYSEDQPRDEQGRWSW